MVAKLGEYKGHPTISLEEEGMFRPFSFGLSKAKMILAHIKEIEDFVANGG